MKINTWLKQATSSLEHAGIGSARLDCLVLLEDELQKDRSWILAHIDEIISKSKIKRLNTKIRKRSNHLPLAFVRGHTQFFGRKFLVNRHVLEPRPESEMMIELLLKINLPSQPLIADAGTGSGALGITAKLELNDAEVDLYDIDASALAVARHNQALHELHLHTRKSNLLSRHIRIYDVIMANLPYVPNSYKVNQAAAMEPRIAIFGGQDGLDIYRRFFTQLQRFTWKPAFVLTEALPPQHAELEKIAAKSGFKNYRSEDFIQLYRPV